VITAIQQQTQSTLLDFFRIEYALEKPSQKLAKLIDLNRP
jgi:hypothetical protein